MTWFGWTFVVLYSLLALFVVSNVGKPRKPTTPGQAAIAVAIDALLIWGALAVGTGSL